MAGWTRNLRSRQVSHHAPGTTIELSESVPSQIPAEQTQTSPGTADNATESATDGTDTSNPSHIQRLQTWWSHNIRLTLSHGTPGGDFRDYLALERTFLSWFRTSVALISFGVLITQLFVLRDIDPKRGKILGAVIACAGIVVVSLGCARYFRQQNLLMQGRALSGGWHHWGLIGVVSGVLMALLVLAVIDG